MSTATPSTPTTSTLPRTTLLTIFVPGYSCRASDFAPLITLLSSDLLIPLSKIQTASTYTAYRFISIDLPGHGETPPHVCARPTVEEFASLVNEIRAEFAEVERGEGASVHIVLVGHSLGARIILEVFLQHQRSVLGMVFVDGSHYLLRPKWYLEQQQSIFGQQGSRTAQTDGRTEKSTIEAQVERENALELLFSAMFSPLTPLDFKTLAIADAKAGINYLVPLRRSHMKWDQDKMDSAVKAVRKSDVQVLVLQSTDGSGIERRGLRVGEENGWMKYVRERLSSDSYETVVVEGCGHFPHVDRTEEVAAAMKVWIQRINIG